MPEYRLPVEISQVISEYAAESLGTGGLEVVNQGRYVQCRMDVDEQMYVVLLAPELYQLAAPTIKNTGKHRFGMFEHLPRERQSPVFGYEHDMQPNQINYMR